MYSKKVIDHFTNPHHAGEIEEADGVGHVGNPVCGDLMTIYIKVDPDTEEITQIAFKTFGCAAAIATSSMVTDLADGMTITEAFNISRKDVAESLGGLPPAKLHCSNLAADGLKAAINDYMKKQGKNPLVSDVHAGVDVVNGEQIRKN
ncbi:MAG: iron-sulfur cluster assembly scaffold protein [Promethearchaeota archaeon]